MNPGALKLVEATTGGVQLKSVLESFPKLTEKPLSESDTGFLLSVLPIRTFSRDIMRV